MNKKHMKKENIKDQDINLLEYDYDNETMIEIPGRLIIGYLEILNQVEQSESNMGFVDDYTMDSPKVSKEGDIVKEIKYGGYENYPSASSYFSQKPRRIKTMLGVMAADLLLLTKQIQIDNIKNGKAKKLGTFEKEEIKL